MERFFWREVDRSTIDRRYSEVVRGYQAWRQLARSLHDARPDQPEEDWQPPFDEFLAAIDQEWRQRNAPTGRPATQTCCLFISHRMSDVDNALHIAWLATQTGYDYWLDIHDPTLIATGGAQLPSPAKDIAIAAVIEMALLNVTHVIALHTRHSAGSKWIPYGLRRAKARLVRSNQAAGWFDRHTSVASCGEYVRLVRQTWSAADIANWLSSASGGRCAPTAVRSWPHGDPPPLDA
jgi:hypothetical protein